MWHSGVVEIDGKSYRWEAKVYDNPSMWGIDNGRVSKLGVSGPDLVYSYDRGHIEGDENHPAVEFVLSFFPVMGAPNES